MYTNGVSKAFTQMAPLKFLPMAVYFNPDSMDKILVIMYVDPMPIVHISMDSRKEREIIV